jgi:hypothetical protein
MYRLFSEYRARISVINHGDWEHCWIDEFRAGPKIRFHFSKKLNFSKKPEPYRKVGKTAQRHFSLYEKRNKVSRCEYQSAFGKGINPEAMRYLSIDGGQKPHHYLKYR